MNSISKFFKHKTNVNKNVFAVIIIALLTIIGVRVLYSSLAATSGIIPPNNPANIAPSPYFLDWCGFPGGVIQDVENTPCIDATQQATTNARASEGLGALFNSSQLGAFQNMPPAEQQFVLVNMERISRGLTPLAGMTSQLDQIAQAGANANTDPNPNFGYLTGGDPVVGGGGNWCDASSSFGCNYGYMYYDGPGSWNIACTPSTANECWLHRDIALDPLVGANWTTPFSKCGSPSNSQLYMGAAYSTTASHTWVSYAQMIVGACGTPPTDVNLTWAQAAAALNANSSASVQTSSNPIPSDDGYWLVASDGGVFTRGSAQFRGSAGSLVLNQPVTGMTSTRDGGGYWLTAADGGVFTYGDAPWLGSGNQYVHSGPFVGIAASSSGGYWQIDSAGEVYGFGGAQGFGNPKGFNGSIVGIAATPDGNGYYAVSSTGEVYAFGDAVWYGNISYQNIVGITASPNGGYWLVSSGGGVFSFNAPFYGSVYGDGYSTINNIVGISRIPDGGYALTASDGTTFWFSSVAGWGTTANINPLNKPVVGIAGVGASTLSNPSLNAAPVPVTSQPVPQPPSGYQAGYAIGADGSVYQSEFSPSIGWTNWVSFGHGMATFTNVVYGINQYNQAVLYATGSDGNLWTKNWNGTSWSGWTSFGGKSGVIFTSVALGRNTINQPILFATDSGGSVWQDSWIGTGWSGWSSIGHASPTTGAVLFKNGLETGKDPNGQMALYATGSDGNIWHTAWTGSAWSGWSSMGNGKSSFSGSVTYGINQYNNVNLFATGSDGNVWQNWWTGTSWSGWSSMGHPSTALIKGVAAARNQLNNDQLVATGSDGNVWQNWWTGSAWSGWSPLGRGSSALSAGITAPPTPLPIWSPPIVNVTAPTNNSTANISQGTLTINFNAVGSEPLHEAKIYIDGKQAGNISTQQFRVNAGIVAKATYVWNLTNSPIAGASNPVGGLKIVSGTTYSVNVQVTDQNNNIGQTTFLVTLK
jgi:hypothetical protein